MQYEDRSRRGTGWTRAQCDDLMRVWGGELLELKGFLSTVPVRMLPMDLPASASRSPFLLLIFVYLLSSFTLHHLPLSPFQSYSTFSLSRFLSFPSFLLFLLPFSLTHYFTYYVIHLYSCRAKAIWALVAQEGGGICPLRQGCTMSWSCRVGRY